MKPVYFLALKSRRHGSFPVHQQHLPSHLELYCMRFTCISHRTIKTYLMQIIQDSCAQYTVVFFQENIPYLHRGHIQSQVSKISYLVTTFCNQPKQFQVQFLLPPALAIPAAVTSHTIKNFILFLEPTHITSFFSTHGHLLVFNWIHISFSCSSHPGPALAAVRPTGTLRLITNLHILSHLSQLLRPVSRASLPHCQIMSTLILQVRIITINDMTSFDPNL